MTFRRMMGMILGYDGFGRPRTDRLAMHVLLLVIAMGVWTTAARAATVSDVAAQAGIAQTAQSFDTLVFDYNNDGQQDILYSPQNGGPRQLWQNNGDGTFTRTASLQWTDTKDQHGCTSADVDHNGLPDIYCALGAIHASRTKQNDLWLQTAPGVFEDHGTDAGVADPTGRSYSANFFDANNDGWPDLFVDNFHPRTDGLPTPNRLFLNLGADPTDGHWLGFADQPNSGVEVEQGNRGCDLSTDFNRDGLQDIVFCGTGTVRMYQNNGDGTFTDVHSAYLGGTSWFAADLKFIDVNGDGLLDLVYIRAGQVGVRLAKPTGTLYASASQTRPLTAGREVAVADVNGDGLLDLYALQGNGAPGCGLANCPTNRDDYLYLGTSLGKFATTGIAVSATGSGDTVDPITVTPGVTDLIVANGANLARGPLQLLAVTP